MVHRTKAKADEGKLGHRTFLSPPASNTIAHGVNCLTSHLGSCVHRWCLLEQGVSKFVAAHVHFVSKSEGGLPPRIAEAERCRPKVVDLTGGRTRPVVAKEQPSLTLKRAMWELLLARFTFDSDRQMALEMMSDFASMIQSVASMSDVESGSSRAGSRCDGSSRNDTFSQAEERFKSAKNIFGEDGQAPLASQGLRWAASIKLQSALRRQRAMRECSAREEQLHEDIRRLDSAVRLQCAFRRRKARQAVVTLHAVTKLQLSLRRQGQRATMRMIEPVPEWEVDLID